MTRRMTLVTRVACNEEGEGDGGKSDGDEGGGRATATRAMATEGEQQSTSSGIEKGKPIHSIQPQGTII